MNILYDSFIKKIDILSQALEKATERTRTMLYVVTFFSLVILVTSFNAYLAWDRKLNAQERLLISEELKLIPSASLKPYNNGLALNLRKSSILKYKNITDRFVDSSIADLTHEIQTNYSTDTLLINAIDRYTIELQSHGLLLSQSDYFKLYLDRQKFTIPIIGLSCYADDVYLIGGLGLLVLLTYSFFSVRRENRIVQRISKSIDFINEQEPIKYLDNHDYEEKEIDLIKHNLLEYVFYGCVEFFIFNTGLTRTDYASSDNKSEQPKIKSKTETNNAGRSVLKIIYFLPIIAMVFAMFFEISSFIDRYKFINQYDHLELFIRYAIAFVFLFINFRQSILINKLNRDNSILIDKMYQIIIKSREKLGLD